MPSPLCAATSTVCPKARLGSEKVATPLAPSAMGANSSVPTVKVTLPAGTGPPATGVCTVTVATAAAPSTAGLGLLSTKIRALPGSTVRVTGAVSAGRWF